MIGTDVVGREAEVDWYSCSRIERQRLIGTAVVGREAEVDWYSCSR